MRRALAFLAAVLAGGCAGRSGAPGARGDGRVHVDAYHVVVTPDLAAPFREWVYGP